MADTGSTTPAAPMSRESAIEAAGALDFDQLVALHRQRVTRLARRLLGWRDADLEDVVHDVFLAALRAAPRFRGECRVSTWLTAITLNTCRNRLRRRWPWSWGAARADAPGSPAAPGPPGIDPETAAEVRQAVAALPVKFREVIVLRYLEELGADEIAAALNRTRGAIEVRLTRARRALRARLEALELDDG